MQRALVLVCVAAALALASASASQADLAQRGAQVLAQLQDGTCGSNGADLSSLTKAAGSKDWNYATSDKHYTWYMNVCADTIDPCLGDSKKAPGVWNYNYQQPYACFNLGDKTKATWSTGADYIAVKYTGGDSCYNTQPASQYSLEQRFKCDSSTPGVLDTVVAGATQCDYIATFRTQAACSGGIGGAGGSTGAWVFNIIVMAGLPLYFACGFLYNWKVKGVEGAERIPNLDFWKDLPHLVKDGCIYFIYLVKLLCHKAGCLATPPEAPLAYSTVGSSSSSSSSSSYDSSSSSTSQAPMDMGNSNSGGSYGTI